MTKPYREESKENYFSPRNENATVEQINCGSFQRIADATELMAKNYAKMERELKEFKDSYRYQRARAESLERSNAALRGVITRMKNKAEK